jgi:hypothetical protein
LPCHVQCSKANKSSVAQLMVAPHTKWACHTLLQTRWRSGKTPAAHGYQALANKMQT